MMINDIRIMKRAWIIILNTHDNHYLASSIPLQDHFNVMATIRELRINTLKK
jgi:hypothetical protein